MRELPLAQPEIAGRCKILQPWLRAVVFLLVYLSMLYGRNRHVRNTARALIPRFDAKVVKIEHFERVKNVNEVFTQTKSAKDTSGDLGMDMDVGEECESGSVAVTLSSMASHNP
jgi:hypothetical protein